MKFQKNQDQQRLKVGEEVSEVRQTLWQQLQQPNRRMKGQCMQRHFGPMCAKTKFGKHFDRVFRSRKAPWLTWKIGKISVFVQSTKLLGGRDDVKLKENSAKASATKIYICKK